MKFEILKPSFSALDCERICIFEGTARLKLYFVQRSKKFFFEMLLSGVVLIAKLCANLAFFSAVGILATSLHYRMQNDYKHLFNITVHRWLPRHSTLLENSVSQKMIPLKQLYDQWCHLSRGPALFFFFCTHCKPSQRKAKSGRRQNKCISYRNFRTIRRYFFSSSNLIFVLYSR